MSSLGYVRVVLAVMACYFMLSNCLYTVICYMLSQALDAVDGFAARSLNQGDDITVRPHPRPRPLQAYLTNDGSQV